MRARLHRVAACLLAFLALALPFEAPLCRVGTLQLTTVEAALYATLAAWGAWVTLEGLSDWPTMARAMAYLRRPMVAATLAWTLALFVSALAAPSMRAGAVKFALRSLSGVLLFFAAGSLGRSPRVARCVLGAVVLGALASAVTAAVDLLFPSTATAWSLFRETGFSAFALPRATGVFAYPTIGAMYWEAAVPLVVLRSLRSDGTAGGWPRSFAAALGVALLAFAILASATRSSLAAAMLVSVVLAVLAWPRSPALARASTGAFGVLLATPALIILISGPRSLLAQRLRFWEDGAWYLAEYALPTTPRVVAAGQTFSTRVTVKNIGTLTWRRGGDEPTRLTDRWYALDAVGNPTALSPARVQRTELPSDVAPGSSIELTVETDAPHVDGRYALAWDLVAEHVTWFGERGNRVPLTEIDVGTAPDAAVASGLDGGALAVPGAQAPPPARAALWRAAVTLWRGHPLLGAGPDSFRHLYQAVLSPGPMGLSYNDERIHANSLYFETLSDLGLAGMGALTWLVLAVCRAIRGARAAGDASGLALAGAAGAFFVHGVSDYFLEFTPTFGLFWLLLGLASAARVPSPLLQRD